MSEVVFDFLSTYKDKNKVFFREHFSMPFLFLRGIHQMNSPNSHFSPNHPNRRWIYFLSIQFSIFVLCMSAICVRQKHLKTKLIDQPWLITFTDGWAIQVSSASNCDHVWQSAAVLFQSSHVKKASAQRTACSSGLEITVEIYDSRCW